MRLFGVVLCLCLMLPAAAQAHDARPLAVTVTEQEKGQFRAELLVPPSVEIANRPQLEWPQGCEVLRSELTISTARCPNGLAGRELAVRWPGYNPALTTLFRINQLDSGTITQLLSPDESSWTVPSEPSIARVALDYLTLGVEHIWLGLDHLLFVAGLLLLARGKRRIVYAITGFTLAHSLTLALATLGVVHVYVPAVEAVIALSILFLAREIAVPRENSIAARNPILVSSLFGLLHGFGFAAVLREIGLPTGELATGLLSFNIGVELGQLAFIAVLLALYTIARFAAANWQGGSVLPVTRLRHLAAYALGIPSAFWLAERLHPLVA